MLSVIDVVQAATSAWLQKFWYRLPYARGSQVITKPGAQASGSIRRLLQLSTSNSEMLRRSILSVRRESAAQSGSFEANS